MKRIISLILIVSFLASCTGERQTDASEQSKKWLGNWVRVEWQNAAELSIEKINGDTLTFSLFASHGASMSELEGVALLKGNKAEYLPKDGELPDCTLTFELKGDTAISITEGEGDCMSGVFVWFGGTYLNGKLPSTKALENKEHSLTEVGPLDSAQDKEMRVLTGDDYKLFVETMQGTIEEEDTALNAIAYASGVQGLYTQMENVIVLDKNNHIWAAVIDDEKIYYYTNHPDYINKLPVIIERWMSRFSHYPVIYKSNPNP